MFEDELASQEDAAEKIGNLLGWSARDTIEILGGPWRAESDIVDSVHPNFYVGRAADSCAKQANNDLYFAKFMSVYRAQSPYLYVFHKCMFMPSTH